MCICCLFFFKQKTAYEMRISDWSSDVCSSDLPDAWRNFGDLLAPIFRNPVTALKAEIATLEAAAKDALQAYAAEQDGRLAAATPAEVLCLEIGRASCRERVCQYV